MGKKMAPTNDERKEMMKDDTDDVAALIYRESQRRKAEEAAAAEAKRKETSTASKHHHRRSSRKKIQAVNRDNASMLTRKSVKRKISSSIEEEGCIRRKVGRDGRKRKVCTTDGCTNRGKGQAMQ